MSEKLKFAPLKEVATFIGGGTPSRLKSEFFGGGIPWVKTTDLANGVIDSTEETLTELGLQNSSCKYVPAHAVLVAMYGGFNQIGRTGLLIRPSAINQALTAIVPDSKKMDSHFLLEWLNFRVGYWKRFAASSRKDPNITKADIEAFPTPLLGITQQKIASEILSHWTKAIEKTERLIEVKERQYSSLLAFLFCQTKENRRWQKKVLAEIAEIRKGQQLSVIDMIADGKYYVLNGGTGPSGYTNTFNAPKNTITISEGGNSCGFVNFNTDDFWAGGHCYVLLNIDESVDPRFLFHYLKRCQPKLMNLRVGSGLPNIQRGALETFVVYVPNRNEQIRMTTLLDYVQAEISILERLVEAYKVQKRGLMQKLLTGEWRVKNG